MGCRHKDLILILAKVREKADQSQYHMQMYRARNNGEQSRYMQAILAATTRLKYAAHRNNRVIKIGGKDMNVSTGTPKAAGDGGGGPRLCTS